MCFSILGIKIQCNIHINVYWDQNFSVYPNHEDWFKIACYLKLPGTLIINSFAILLTLSDIYIYVYFLCCDRPSGKLKYTYIDCFRTVNKANNYSISTSQLVAYVS